jgi:hypothetical protein
MVILAEIVLPPIALDGFVLMSVLLAGVGTLYLAYDLLGRQHGPLRWLTLLITCGLVSAFVLGFVGMVINLLLDRSFSMNATLRFLIVGGLIGVFTVVLVDFPASRAKPPILSRRGSAIGLALGLIFFFTVLLLLQGTLPAALVMGATSAALASLWPYLTWDPSPTRPPVFSRRGLVVGLLPGLLVWSVFFFLASHDVVASVLGSIPLALVSGGIISLWRFMHWEEETEPRSHVFSRKGFLVGFVIGFVPWLITTVMANYAAFAGFHLTGGLASWQHMELILLIITNAGILALASAAAGSISRYMLRKANTIPLRRLGAFGLVLILLATSLQGVQPAIDLINILSTVK